MSAPAALDLPRPPRVFVPRVDGGFWTRAARWPRKNLFYGWLNTALTIVTFGAIALIVPPLFRWGVSHATLSGMTRAACVGDGACWTFIRVRLPTFIFGRYPADERWRVVAAFAVLAALVLPVVAERTRHRGPWVIALLTVAPLVGGVLLAGGVFGLAPVDTNSWGGLMLDVVIAFVAIAGSLPLGILLALGRRSSLGVVRALCTGFIELWRGRAAADGAVHVGGDRCRCSCRHGVSRGPAAPRDGARWCCSTPPTWPRWCAAGCRACRRGRRRRPIRSA